MRAPCAALFGRSPGGPVPTLWSSLDAHRSRAPSTRSRTAQRNFRTRAGEFRSAAHTCVPPAATGGLREIPAGQALKCTHPNGRLLWPSVQRGARCPRPQARDGRDCFPAGDAVSWTLERARGGATDEVAGRTTRRTRWKTRGPMSRIGWHEPECSASTAKGRLSMAGRHRGEPSSRLEGSAGPSGFAGGRPEARPVLRTAPRGSARGVRFLATRLQVSGETARLLRGRSARRQDGGRELVPQMV